MHRLCIAALVAALLVVFEAPKRAQEAKAATPTVEALQAKIEENGDLVDPDVVHDLAALGTGEALDQVLAACERFQTVYMRRIAIGSLVRFAGKDELEPRALAKLRACALARDSRETAEAAVTALASFRASGHAQLRDVAARAPLEDVRLLALKEHTAVPEPSDAAWYRELWAPEPATAPPAAPKLGAKNKPQAGKGKATIPPPAADPEAEPPARAPTEAMRVLAFDALSARLSTAELTQALDDRNPEIASSALLRLESNGAPEALALAKQRYASTKERATVRGSAAGVIARADGKPGVLQLIDDAGSAEMPRRLLDELASIVGAALDAEVEKRLQKLVGKGSQGARLFALRALAKGSEAKYDDAIAKELDEKDEELVLAAAEALSQRRAKDQAGAIQRALDRAKDGSLRASLLGALSRLLKDDAAWRARLSELANDPDDDVRNAATVELGRGGSDKELALLAKLLDHPRWSTRLAAMRGLELLHREECVELLIERLSKEHGRLTMDFAGALQRLTGRSFGAYADLWRNWWDKRPADWRLPGSGAAPSTSLPRTEVREVGGTRVANFFGARVTSERVAFVIDISGSMEELAADGDTRLDHARKKLVAAIQNLSPETQYNVIVFSTSATAWRRGVLVTGKNAKEKQPTAGQAAEWLEKLRAGGGTNLYGALELAFADSEVDTIYLLTDGEPTQGAIIDPVAIRQRIQLWNRHRGVVIHAIAFGGSFPVLEWLAGDSGGTYRYIP
ncbi:MAG: VWA domain-containing protein [Planctomycetota bacterium]|nr:MAG: VWA domain-containing protein [Planctomycetota bacterium]